MAQTQTVPTPHQAKNIERILLTTKFKDGGYIAQCTVNQQALITEPKNAPYAAINHLINVVVGMKKEKGQIRDFHYIFTTKL